MAFTSPPPHLNITIQYINYWREICSLYLRDAFPTYTLFIKTSILNIYQLQKSFIFILKSKQNSFKIKKSKSVYSQPLKVVLLRLSGTFRKNVKQFISSFQYFYLKFTPRIWLMIHSLKHFLFHEKVRKDIWTGKQSMLLTHKYCTSYKTYF